MQFEIIPVAYASVSTLVNSIEKVVINPLIIMVFAIAFVYFLYGVIQFVLNPENQEKRSVGKSHMLWGIVGIFIMVAVFGIMRLILNTLGEKSIKVQDTGSITITPKP
jgi:uncharacterized membrane protein